MEKEYNATCLITGKTDNIRMHALRDKNEGMVGWVFLHESIRNEEINASIDWKFKVKVNE